MSSTSRPPTPRGPAPGAHAAAAPAVTELGHAQERLRAGDRAGARAIVEQALARPGASADARAAALKLRSRIHEAGGDLAAAVADLRAAAELAPSDARVRNELGIVLADAGNIAGAIDALRQAVALDPGYARAWNNLGNALRSRGLGEQAREAFGRAVALDPRYVLAWTNLAVALRDEGDDRAAANALERALATDPNNATARVMRAALARDEGDLDLAVAHLTRALQLNPADANAWLMLGESLAERDDLAAAGQALQQALARDPGMLRAALALRLTLPMVPASGEAVSRARGRFAEGLSVLERELPARAAALGAARVHDELRWTNFLLAYQGEDDVALQSRYGDLVSALAAARIDAPAADPQTARGAQPNTQASSRRVRVGFVFAFFRDGTAGRYFERWVTDLPRERFEVQLFVLNAAADALTARVAARADATHHVARLRPSELSATVRDARLDVIVYPELGMNATAFALAATRLAPVQCAGWGHPVTSGLPTIDAYFTSAPMEPPDGPSHYRERLIELPGLGTRYAMPSPPPAGTRAAFRLPDDATLLLCPQSLFKIHPDNDALFARVLRDAPQAHLVLFRGRHPALTRAYVGRLGGAASAHGVSLEGRLHVLSHVGHPEYLGINALCDLMLDTLHWSGGNTSLDAIASGLPIVTLPGRFMRGRQSAAMLRMMGVEDTVARDADDYVRIATRLAQDASARAALRRRMQDARHVLFDDPAPVAAFAASLEALARPARLRP